MAIEFVRKEAGYYQTADGNFVLTNPKVRNWYSGRLATLPEGWSVVEVDAYLAEDKRVRWWNGKGVRPRDRQSEYRKATFVSFAGAKHFVREIYEGLDVDHAAQISG